MKALCSLILILLIKLELKDQDIYGETLHDNFSHKYHTEKSAVQMYISPYQFNTLNATACYVFLGQENLIQSFKGHSTGSRS